MNVSIGNQNKLDSEQFRSCGAMARSNGTGFHTTTSPSKFVNWLNVELRSPAGFFCDSCPSLIGSQAVNVAVTGLHIWRNMGDEFRNVRTFKCLACSTWNL